MTSGGRRLACCFHRAKARQLHVDLLNEVSQPIGQQADPFDVWRRRIEGQEALGFQKFVFPVVGEREKSVDGFQGAADPPGHAGRGVNLDTTRNNPRFSADATQLRCSLGQFMAMLDEEAPRESEALVAAFGRQIVEHKRRSVFLRCTDAAASRAQFLLSTGRSFDASK